MEKEEWQRLYDSAKSASALGKELGFSRSWVAKELKRCGIENRIKRPSHPGPPPTNAAIENWQAMYKDAGSIEELARRLGKTGGTIRYHLKRHGIAIESTGFRSPKAIRHYGSDHGSWKGGTYYHADGYVYQYAPDHPDAPKGKGYVLQHRLVMEDKLGRPLRRGELVHHINEVKDDNRPENLELHDRSTHMKHHKELAARDKLGRFAEGG